jgi:hypothetical protein
VLKRYLQLISLLSMGTVYAKDLFFELFFEMLNRMKERSRKDGVIDIAGRDAGAIRPVIVSKQVPV